jgi:hypothetical protein
MDQGMSHRNFALFLIAFAYAACVEVLTQAIADDQKGQAPAILIPPRGKYSEVRCVDEITSGGDPDRTFSTRPFLLFGSIGEKGKGTSVELQNPDALQLVLEQAKLRSFDVKGGSVLFAVVVSENRVADSVLITIRAISNTGWQFSDSQRLRIVADRTSYDCGNVVREVDANLLRQTLTSKSQMYSETIHGKVPLAAAVHLAKARQSAVEIGGAQYSLDTPRLTWTREQLRVARGEPPPKSVKSKSTNKAAQENADSKVVLTVGLKTGLMDLLSELSESTRTVSGTRIAVDPNLANALNNRSIADRNAKQEALSEAEREKRDADEAKAEGSLSLAEQSIEKKRFDLAKKLLKGLIDRYPETTARAKAEELLKTLPK